MINAVDFISQLGEGIASIFLQSLAGLIYGWPVSIALLISLILSLVIHWPLRDSTRRRHFRWALLAFLPPLVLAAVGAAFPYSGPPQKRGTAPDMVIGLVYSILAVHIGLVVALLIRSPGSRWRIAPLLLTSLWWAWLVCFATIVVIIGVGP